MINKFKKVVGIDIYDFEWHWLFWNLHLYIQFYNKNEDYHIIDIT